MDKFKKLAGIVESYSPKNYSVILIVPVVFYVLGFFIWNVYLSYLGFGEDEFLKSKFILAGFIFVVISFIGISVFSFFQKIFNWIKKIPTIIFAFWFFIYVFFIFPIVPNFLGGGKPRPVSLISDYGDIFILNSLGINKGLGASNQTEISCLFHENSKYIFIMNIVKKGDSLSSDRLMMLDRSLIDGLNSHLDESAIKACSLIGRMWISDRILKLFNFKFYSWPNLSDII